MLFAHSAPIQHGVVIAICLTGTVAYAVRWSSDPGRRRSGLVCWALAVGGILVATMPAIEAGAERSFTAHMVQHLLLIAVVAPALVIALEPATTRWWRSGPRVRKALRLLDRPWASSVAASMFVGTLIVTHLTGIYDAALGSQVVHEAEHLAYLTTAMVLWWTLRAGATRRDIAAPFGRIAASLGVIAGTAVLGLVLVTADAPLISTYIAQQGVEDALADQRRAAALMWVGGMLTTLPLLVLAFWRWASYEESTTRRAEQLLEARVLVARHPD